MKLETKLSVGLIFLFRVHLNSIDSVYNGRVTLPTVLLLFIHTWSITLALLGPFKTQSPVKRELKRAFISLCIHFSSFYLVPFKKITKLKLVNIMQTCILNDKKSCCGKKVNTGS